MLFLGLFFVIIIITMDIVIGGRAMHGTIGIFDRRIVSSPGMICSRWKESLQGDNKVRKYTIIPD